MEAHCPNVYLIFDKPFMIPCHLMTRTYKAKVKNMEQQRMAWYAIRQCSSSKHLTMYEHLINIVIYHIRVIHFLTLLVTRTAARLKPRYKKHGYSDCPTPSNAKYKESKWLWATQLGKWIVCKQWQFWCDRLELLRNSAKPNGKRVHEQM